MKKLSWLAAVLAITVLFFQCQKELSPGNGSGTIDPVLPDPITASLQGNITDENDQPAAGVTVTAGTSTTITDAGGYFRFTDARLDKNTTLVAASKDGYFKGYRVFGATSGCNQVVIKLVKKDLAGTVAASAGGEVSVSSGAKISLPAGGIVTASSNSAYSGDVKVYASYINPAGTDISKTVPGSFVANDSNGKRVLLSSYGMLAVELASSGGEKLQIKSGSTATLTIPIPSQSVASAPATIPLWYVDETTGLWQEEGTATKQGNNYVGEVKHFSFWNCDYPLDAVRLSLTLQTPSGSPLIYSQVQITATSTSDTGTYNSVAYGYTDSLGKVEGMVPVNSTLTMKVSGNCGSVIYSQTIQPLSSDKDLGTIKITDNTSSLFTVTGTLADCNSSPVTKGYAIISFDDGSTRYVTIDNSGKFTTTYIRCSASSVSSVIIGVDEMAQQQSEAISVTLSSATTDAGIITACGTSSEQYINYKLDGTDYKIGDSYGDSTTYGTTYNNALTYIKGFAQSGNLLFSSVTATTGTFPISAMRLQNYDSITLKSSSTVTFSNYPASAGEFYEGSLTAEFTNAQSADIHTLTGTFKVRRSN